MITFQLQTIFQLSRECIYDSTEFKEANVESYYARNMSIINAPDIIYAFQVNDSKGTQDAINKAKEFGKPTYVKKYYID